MVIGGCTIGTMSLPGVRAMQDLAPHASDRADDDFVVACRAKPHVPGATNNPWVVGYSMTLFAISNGPPLLAWASIAASVAATVAWILVGRERRRRAAAAMVIRFPTNVRGAPAKGLLVVGASELMTWPRWSRQTPVAAVPRDRIYDATFEDGHRLIGGGWIHLVGVDGKRMILGVRSRDVAAGRRVAYALSRQADSPRW